MVALGRSDIAAIGEKLLLGLIEQQPPSAMLRAIRVTSGTSGKPVVMVNHYHENIFKKFSETGNIVICAGSMSVRLANILFARQAPGSDVRVLMIDRADVAEDISKLLAGYEPTTFDGTPSFVTEVALCMDTATRRRVKLLLLSGERLSPERNALLKKHFENARIELRYSATEIGLITSRSCTLLPPNHYHPHAGVTLVIENTDASGVGDIVVSKTLGSGIRIEKYHIGDVGRVISKPCPCGASMTFEHLGRSGRDYIKIRGALLVREEFDRVVARLSPPVLDYRLVASEVAHDGITKGKIVLTIYCGGKAGTEALALEMSAQIAKNLFVTSTRTLQDLTEQGIFLPLEVVFTSAAFEQKNKDTRLTHIQ